MQYCCCDHAEVGAHEVLIMKSLVCDGAPEEMIEPRAAD